MGFKKVIADYLGKLSELVSGDTIAPSQLGSGTIVDRSILKGDGSWGNNDNAVLFVDVDSFNSPLNVPTIYEDTIVIIQTDGTTGNEVILESTEGVKLTCHNLSGGGKNVIVKSITAMLNYPNGYLLYPSETFEINTYLGDYFASFQNIPLFNTINHNSGSLLGLSQLNFENGKNLFVDADVPSGGMAINLPLISTLRSLDVTITIKYRNYVVSTDTLTINSQGTDYLDGFSTTSLALNRYDAITFKPHSTGEWLQIGKFNFFQAGSLPTGGTAGQVLAKINATDYNTQWVTPSGGGGTPYITTEIDFGTTPVSSKLFTIPYAGIVSTDIIQVFSHSAQATDRKGDDWEFDTPFFIAKALTGEFTLNVSFPHEVVGKRSIKYKIN